MKFTQLPIYSSSVLPIPNKTKIKPINPALLTSLSNEHLEKTRFRTSDETIHLNRYFLSKPLCFIAGSSFKKNRDHSADLPFKDFKMSQHLFRPNDLHGKSIDPINRDSVSLRPGAYGYGDISGLGVRAEPSIAGLTAGMSNRSYATLDDPIIPGPIRGGSMGISPIPLVNADVAYEMPGSLPRVNGLSLPPKESNILFVDGLPTDCTRREVGHIFRPFIGFKDIKVIHKEPRRSGDKAMVLCFVEFNDPKCALTAMDALQGYKFDDRKPDSSILRVRFAHFPLRLPSEHEDQRFGSR